MIRSGRSGCLGRSSGVIRSRSAFQLPRALPKHTRDSFGNYKTVPDVFQKQTFQKRIVSQSSSSSQASVTLRAPSNAQQTLSPQEDAVPRSVLVAIDYTSDAEQALQWALDFVVKPGMLAVLKPRIFPRTTIHLCIILSAVCYYCR